MSRSSKIKLSGLSKLPPALPELAQLQHFRQRIVAALAARPAPSAQGLQPIADQVLVAAHFDEHVTDLEVLAEAAAPDQAMAMQDFMHVPPTVAADILQDALADPTSHASQLALLRRLAASRYGAYRTETGYSIGGGGGPEVRDETVQALIAGGWAFDEPSGGRLGSVKISADGRARLGAGARIGGASR